MKLRIVVDTNVLFEGLTRKGGSSGLLVSAWVEDLFTPCVSNALIYEYLDVFSRKFSEAGWRYTEPIVNTLLTKAEFTPIRYSYRPSVPDPKDEHVVDCVMNSNTALVTNNLKDFENAALYLGFELLQAPDFIKRLVGEKQ